MIQRQEEAHRQESKQWQENGYSGDSVEIKHQLKELKALVSSLQEEKDRIVDDREKSELLYKEKIDKLEKEHYEKIDNLEKELDKAIIERDGSKEYAERA